MKAFAFVLLCALAAVQGRYSALQPRDDELGVAAPPGQDPYLVNLRIAVSTSGLLNTGAGSLISERYVLTTAANIVDARFIWLLFGAVDVIKPALVLETTVVSVNPNYNATTGEHNIGVVDTGRNIEYNAFIAPIALVSRIVGPGKVCVYGSSGLLRCFPINAAKHDNAGLAIGGSNGPIPVTIVDIGTPAISDDGGQFALLVAPGDGTQENVGDFIAVDEYFEWIETETGLELNPDAIPDDAADPAAVHFVQ